MCLTPKRGYARLQMSLAKSKNPHSQCERLNKAGLSLLLPRAARPPPSTDSSLEDGFHLAPGGSGGRHLPRGRGCDTTATGGARGRGTVDSSSLTVLVLVEDGRPVRVAAPHLSPQPAPHPPPPASRGARRQAPRRRGSCPPAAAAACPAPARPGQARPGPTGGASAGLTVTRRHGSDPSAPGRDRYWLARTDLARLSSRRGRGGRELGEEGGIDGGREGGGGGPAAGGFW